MSSRSISASKQAIHEEEILGSVLSVSIKIGSGVRSH